MFKAAPKRKKLQVIAGYSKPSSRWQFAVNVTGTPDCHVQRNDFKISGECLLDLILEARLA